MSFAEEIHRLADEFESKTPQEILEWALREYGDDIAMSSSFQTQSMPLLHMAMRIKPDIRIFFLDTGYHFWETLTFREKMQQEWNLNIIDLRREPRWDAFVRPLVRSLPLNDPNLCCYVHKVQPCREPSIACGFGSQASAATRPPNALTRKYWSCRMTASSRSTRY
jgi:phosphoadenosine phosphosulfate reductase